MAKAETEREEKQRGRPSCDGRKMYAKSHAEIPGAEKCSKKGAGKQGGLMESRPQAELWVDT